MRQVLGALLMAGAVAMAAGDVDGSGGLQVGMLIIGGQVIIDGFNISKQADINAAAIKELGESFENEMKPVVMDFEGKEIGSLGEFTRKERKDEKQRQ